LGSKNFTSDYEVQLSDTKFVVEIKIITKSKPHHYWHAAIQGLIYQFWLKGSCPVICIILDWGRGAGKDLSSNDKDFLNQFKAKSIYFVRLNLKGDFFIQHNLMSDEWDPI